MVKSEDMDVNGNILMEKYELGRLLGQGSFAKVYYARDVTTGQSVAIKVIDKDKISEDGLIDHIKREIHIMKLVRHPNIVQLYEVMATKTKIYFVLEYAKNGELFDKVVTGKLKEQTARKYFHQLINAVDFCHSRGVYHRDLKPENLLLDEDDNLKVSDFGLSAFAESRRQDGLLHTTCGTPAYVAPEVITRKGYDGDKADVWSCGVILFVLLAGYLPFNESNIVDTYRKIWKSDFKFPNWIQPDARRLLSKILDPNPVKRATISKIKESSWFKKEKKSNQPCLDNSLASSTTNNQESTRPPSMNAFDIISLSHGFDLRTLFEEPRLQKEARFTIWRPASVILSKLEEIGKNVRMKVSKREAGLLKLEGEKEGRKGILSIDAEIFALTSCFHLVEVKKSNGDTLEYQKVLDEGLRPGLEDIVWLQGDEQEQKVSEQDQ
ncbi:CBL-interacting protein kinase 18-like [Rutidosis leptorrhynchoides]|uniref:CBL-interacting protein kinase 18-like n=1 Tax=Rutidosis leptorrhynchoides TaxID=125765 RepID=UPI003A99EB99